MDPSIWNLLHDGWIVSIEILAPNELLLSLECGYLRERFPAPGGSFRLRLAGCSLCEFVPFDVPAISDLQTIAALELEILSANEGSRIEVLCEGGFLRLSYESFGLQLDSGQSISVEQLTQTAREYWDDWERNRPAR